VYTRHLVSVRLLVGVAVLLVGASEASAELTPGGGSSKTDCMVVLDADVNHPEGNPRNIRCTDGDPSCDGDATVNGVCEFDVSVCLNSTIDPERCSLVGVREILVRHSIDDADDPKFDPDFQALQSNIENIFDPDDFDVDDCTPSPTTISVRIQGPIATSQGNKCKSTRKILRIDAESSPQSGKFFKDRDKIKLTCDPQFPSGCDPQVLFAGTFDRINRQIFNTTCAVSGCHDSESYIAAGVLLLEESASYNNLINIPPTNGPANSAGWDRVTVTVPDVSGDPETSFLIRKLNDDFPGPGFGDRMPLVGKKLDPSLRDIITLWITAGAPENGWVPGTD
jgi:hypothetical protein